LNESNIVKVVSPLLYTDYENAYKYRLANESYKSTYSPELLGNFKHRIQSPQYDREKSDVFSLGISILSYIT